MLENITPVHIGAAIGAAAALAALLVFLKNRSADKGGRSLARTIRGKDGRAARPVPLAEAAPPEAEGRSDGEPAESAPAPAAEAPGQADLPFEPTREQRDSIVRNGRAVPNSDPAVHAVIKLTPKRERFHPDNLLRAAQTRRKMTEALRQLCLMDWHDSKTGLWLDEPLEGMTCDEVRLALKLARRASRINEVQASTFISFADQLAVALDAERDDAESSKMVESADELARVLAECSRVLTVRLKAASEISDEALRAAAVACGFAAARGAGDGAPAAFEKCQPGCPDPLYVLQRPGQKEVRDCLELSLDVPLAQSSTHPWARFVELANDLCCRLGAVMTDASGNLITPAFSVVIDQQLGQFYNEMAELGFPAGSPRAQMLFSRA